MQKSAVARRDFYDTTGTEDWIDEDGEVRELTREEIASMTPFEHLPEDLKAILKEVKHATIRPDLRTSSVVAKEKVTLEISKPILERFKAQGAGWESKVDAALLEWLEENKAS